MTWAAVAIVGGVTALGGTIYGANKAANATKSASKAAVSAQNYATDVANKQYEEEVAREKPFYDIGVSAIPAYQKLISGGYNMKESPAAQYQLQTGTKALNRSLAARGLLGSGNAAQRLTELNQSIAASDWKDQYSRIVDALKLGTGAASSMNTASQGLTSSTGNTSTNISNILTNQGNNMASLYAGIPGAISSTFATGINAYNALKGSNSFDYTKEGVIG
jgi:hypothetical protein